MSLLPNPEASIVITSDTTLNKPDKDTKNITFLTGVQLATSTHAPSYPMKPHLAHGHDTGGCYHHQQSINCRSPSDNFAITLSNVTLVAVSQWGAMPYLGAVVMLTLVLSKRRIAEVCWTCLLNNH